MAGCGGGARWRSVDGRTRWKQVEGERLACRRGVLVCAFRSFLSCVWVVVTVGMSSAFLHRIGSHANIENGPF